MVQQHLTNLNIFSWILLFLMYINEYQIRSLYPRLVGKKSQASLSRSHSIAKYIITENKTDSIKN